MKSKMSVRLFALMTTILMLVALIPVLGRYDVSEAATDDGKQIYDNYMRTEPPEHYEDQGYEPYGYGKDVPFFLNKQSELLFYRTSKQSKGDINTFYDKLDKASEDDPLNSSKKVSAMATPPDKLKKAYFVQAVACDPTGSSRKDHIAFIGVYGAENETSCYIWVYNTKNRKWTSELDLGHWCKWMEKQHITDYEAVHFLSITAGDYDADGKDTIVAYCSFDQYCDCYEVECTSDFKLKKIHTGEGLCHDECAGLNGTDCNAKTQMACELDTGDVTGDGIDDLISLTYIGDTNIKERELETYRPCIKVTKGGVKDDNIVAGYDYLCEVWSWDQGYWFDSMVSPGMSVGDMDHDGKDEIVTAGIYCPMKMKEQSDGTLTSERIHDDIDPSTIFACIIGINEDDKAVREYAGTVDSNAWTKSGFYEDEDIWTKCTVQCAAINGLGNPEMAFISGTLYSLNNKTLKAEKTPEIFGSSGDNLSSKSSTNMFVQSAAGGNFDGNDKGYEQVAYVVSAKTNGKRSYDYMSGVVGGTDYNNTTGKAKKYYATKASQMDDDHAWPGRGKDNASGYISDFQGLNCIVVAADTDNDGALARYKEKCLIYADPEVLCVLQAPPYFSQIADYLTDSPSNQYSITNTYEFESSESDSVSYGVGVVAGMESPAIQMELTAGYALDWTKEFTKGLSESVSYGWTATEKDIVVVLRKPVVSYTYQLQSSNGDWGDESVVITVPCEPDYQTMGVSQYNSFAKYYNDTISKYLTDFHKLDTLNNKWLGHEGDPQKYIKWTNSKFKTDSAYKIIQTTPLNLGHTSESVSWGKTAGSSVGVTESMSHGFTYDATIALGANVGAASLTVGLTTSLEYMTGNSTSQTQTQEKGISCEINALQADAPESIKPFDYNFSFKMARWPSGLKRYVEGKPEDVPVYGFALSGVTVPADMMNGVSVEDQLAASKVTETVNELPTVEDITPADEEKVAEARGMYEALSDDAKSLVDEYELNVIESRIDLIKDGGVTLDDSTVVLSKSEFTYNKKAQKPVIKTVDGYILEEGLDYTIEWSNESSTTPGTYTLKITGISDLCKGTTEVTYKINKATNTMTAKGGKTATVKYSKLRKRNQTVKRAKVMTIKKNVGKLTFTKFKGSPKITINKKTGQITVKKGLKKGTYTVKVKVKAAGNSYYKAMTKKVSFKIKVK